MSQAGMETFEKGQEAAKQPEKQSEKELNFNKLRQGYEKELERERAERQKIEQEVAQLKKYAQQAKPEEDDYDDEPYVDHRKLDKKLSKFEQKLEEKIEKKAEEKARFLIEQNKQQTWFKNNPDFYEVMQHAEKFAEKDPELAETILEMPEGFERQKLVYKNIKALGLHKKEEPKSNIQDKIDQNRRSPYYQPSGVGTAPYNTISIGKDVSPAEGKAAYAKLQELKGRLRLG